MPARFLRRAIAICLPADDELQILQDLDALYEERVRRRGLWNAKLWYARQALGFIARVGTARLASFVATGVPDVVRYSVRGLLHDRAFSFAFVMTLAVGVGVVSTTYATARWVLLRPVPGVAQPRDLVVIYFSMEGAPDYINWGLSQPDLEVFQSRLPANRLVAGSTSFDADVRLQGDQPRRLSGEMVTANYFNVLGARLVAGRGFVSREDREVIDKPAVIASEELATRTSGGPSALVGTDIEINGTTCRVIGVAKSEFRGWELPGTARIWLPLSAIHIIAPQESSRAAMDRGDPVWQTTIARPRPGSDVAAIQREADATMHLVVKQFAGTGTSFTRPKPVVRTYQGIGASPGVRRSVQRTLSLIGGAALVLLLLATANLVNLTLVRATVRAPKSIIRLALGASKARLIWESVVDSLVLAIFGGVVAIILSLTWTAWYRATQLDTHGAPLTGLRLDGTVVLTTLFAASVAALLAFLKPALEARTAAAEAVFRGVRAGRSSQALRSALVSIQVAMTVMLLVGAGLLARTVLELRKVELGFEPARLLTFGIDPYRHGMNGKALAELARAFEPAAQRLPEARNASLIAPRPFGSGWISASVKLPGEHATPLTGAAYYVSSGFMATIGALAIAGDGDWRADSGTVVLTRSAARKLFATDRYADLIGSRVVARRDTLRLAAVIEDVRLNDLMAEPPPAFFLPLGSRRGDDEAVAGIVRTAGAPMRVANGIRDVVESLGRDLTVFDVRSARDAIDRQFAARTAMARAGLTLGIIGLLLAGIGLYGVLANLVAARTKEFGIRAALGAGPRRIAGAVAAAGLLPVCAGSIAGIVGAAGVTRMVRSQLFAIAPSDATTWVGVLGVLGAVSVLACAIPAFRASRVAPADVLKAE